MSGKKQTQTTQKNSTVTREWTKNFVTAKTGQQRQRHRASQKRKKKKIQASVNTPTKMMMMITPPKGREKKKLAETNPPTPKHQPKQ
jgi:hypothetical protein